MNNFSSNNLYIGSLMIVKDGKINTYKENIYLIYDETTDRFYKLEQTLNEFLDLSLNTKLTEEEKKKYIDTIKKHEYSSNPANEENKIYVDINTLVPLTANNKGKN